MHLSEPISQEPGNLSTGSLYGLTLSVSRGDKDSQPHATAIMDDMSLGDTYGMWKVRCFQAVSTVACPRTSLGCFLSLRQACFQSSTQWPSMDLPPEVRRLKSPQVAQGRGRRPGTRRGHVSDRYRLA